MMRKNSSLFYKPPQKEPPKQKWIILPYIWRALKYTCMSIGAMILLSLVLSLFVLGPMVSQVQKETAIPDEMILFYRIDGEIPEGPTLSGFDAFGPQKLSLQKIIDTLEEAESDPRVKAFIVSIRRSELFLSQLQELREAVQSFRERSGKPAYIYSLSYGEAGQGLSLYSFASVFDEIWLSPLGTVSINGFRLEQPYMRDLLDRLGVDPEFVQREEYKGVFENFTNTQMSKYSRESLQALSESLVKEFIKDILVSRTEMAEKKDLSQLINTGIFLDKEAEKLGLVDRVEYGDILLDELRVVLGGDADKKTPELVKLSNYYAHIQNNKFIKEEKPADIAVIYVQGPIMVFSEDEGGNSLLGQTSKSADKIANLIIQAAENDKTTAIVVRIDSPGGSPTASELIRRAIVQAKEKDKPVIVSMGSTAASGGYWVASAADRIFALPTTLTGSIGVAGGKVSLKEFWSNIDVNWDHVGVGQNAGLYSINEPFSPQERELVEKTMDRVYGMFLDVVAEGRDMTREEAREVARGRVWSGAQAQDNGLVDELGGLNAALDYAAMQAGYSHRKELNIITLPEPKTPLEQLLELFQQTAGINQFLQQQTAIINLLGSDRATKQLLQDAAILQNGSGVYVYDPVEELR